MLSHKKLVIEKVGSLEKKLIRKFAENGLTKTVI